MHFKREQSGAEKKEEILNNQISCPSLSKNAETTTLVNRLGGSCAEGECRQSQQGLSL